MFGAVLGVLILGEVLTMPGWSGVSLIVIGVVLVTLDPGGRGEEGGPSGAIKGGSPPFWVIIALICSNAYAFYNSECIWPCEFCVDRSCMYRRHVTENNKKSS